MPSATITGDRKQLTLAFEGGLTHRFRCAREAAAQGIYRRGLKVVAADLDMAPGNLSVALSDPQDQQDRKRKFSVDELERYIQTSGDLTPVYYFVERYLGDQAAMRDQALGQVADLIQQLPAMLAAAGIDTKRRQK